MLIKKPFIKEYLRVGMPHNSTLNVTDGVTSTGERCLIIRDYYQGRKTFLHKNEAIEFSRYLKWWYDKCDEEELQELLSEQGDN